MSPLRARLVASRPEAASYAATLASMPADLSTLTGRIARLTIYPVKGLGGLDIPRVTVSRDGLVDPMTLLADRGVMLAALHPGETADGASFDAITVSNRTEGVLALSRARVDGGALVYTAPGLPPLRLDPASLAARDGPAVRVRLYDGGPVIEGARLDGPLAAWVRALLDAHPRRRRFETRDVIALAPRRGTVRLVAERHRAGEDARTLFGDGGHLLIANAATLAWMNDALRDAGAREIDMEVFRPNVVVDGLPPNVEDLIGEAAVEGEQGPARFAFASFCVRCDATRVDIRTGEKPDREPLAFLARERPPRGDDPRSATFAINAVARAQTHGRTLAVGDAFRPLAERAA